MNAVSRKVLVSGVSGPIGAALLPSLTAAGYEITRLVRDGSAGLRWNPAQPLDPAAVSGFDVVIHLAGEPIVGRWTDAKKAAIRDSRVLGTRHITEALVQAAKPPKVLISASAIGYYGDRSDELLREESSPGSGFLAEVCRESEAAAEIAARAGIRAVPMRIGLVLSPAGGALKKMLTPFRMGVGGRIGSGRQWWSWVHVQDIVGAVHHIMSTNSLRGPVNTISPNPVTNAEFTKVLGAVLSRPVILPMPAFAARLAFGELANQLLLASQRVEPAKLLASGYKFQYPDLTLSLRQILKRQGTSD